MTEARAGNCVKVIGPAGSGKTTVQVAVANEALTWNNETVILWIAPYNSQVDSLKSKLRKWPHLWEALKRGKHVRTAASVFGFPKGGGGVPERIAHRLSSKDRALLQKPKLLLLIDEADLLTPMNRDVMSRVLQIVRGDPSVNGGVQIVEVGDPMQGAPYLGDNEKADCIPGRKDLGARKEITVEAEAMKSSALKVVMLTDTPRFDTKLYRDAAAEARLGFKGPCLIALLELACKRVLTAEEELSKMSLFGTNKQVMDCSLRMMEKRAASRGLTVANGGVYRYVAVGSDALEEDDVNQLRTFGYERITFVKGEEYLMLVKTTEEEDAEPDDPQALRFDNGMYATGNAPCICIGWQEGEYVEVRMHGGATGTIKVPLMERTVQGVSLPLFALKPSRERVIDLAQGLEWDGVVEVDASRIFGAGKLYVALTRARCQANLKVTNLQPTTEGLKNVLRSSWRGLHWLQTHGVVLPSPCSRYAAKMAKSHQTAYAAFDAK
jgi:hypothetical protein